MRPVNLIPPEDRHGEVAPLRTGPTAYALVGGLAVILLTVIALVLTGNGIKERQAELDSLEARKQAAETAAAALTPYTQFATMAAAREVTVTSLAQSRFDWERVLRELSLVIPEDVTLESASGSAAGSGADAGSSLAGNSSGPALSLTGCAAAQRSVAAFAAALHDIDGVTRVGVSSSQVTQDDAASAGDASSSDCTGTKFDVTAVFDGVATPAGATAVPDAAAPATATAATDPGTADAVAEEQQARDASAEQTDKARKAANLAPGVDQ